MDDEARPIEVGEVISESFRVVGENFGVFAVIAALVMVPNAVMGVALQWVMNDFVTGTVVSAQTPELILAAFWRFLGALVATTVVSMVLYAFGQAGAMYVTVEHLVGRKASVGDALRVAVSRFFSVFLCSIVVSMIVSVGMLLCIVPGLVAWVWLSMALPAIVAERIGPIAAISRSLELSEGHRWQIFLVYLVVFLAFVGLSVCIIGPASMIAGQGAGDELPDPLAPGQLVVTAINLVVQCASFMAFSALVSVVYARLRGLRDGVDANALAQVFA